MARKVAFVTGASRGIGKAAAIALAEAGFDVAVTARTVQEGEKYDYGTGQPEQAMPGSIQITAEEVRKRGRKALAMRVDLLDRHSIDMAVERTLQEWSQIDVLLNNGIYQGPGILHRFLDLTDEMLKNFFEGNVFAQIHLTQKVLPSMLLRRDGIIINMTSGAALRDPPSAGSWGFAYASSKAAFHRMAGIVHVELCDQGIRTYIVNPGLTVTEFQEVAFGKDSARLRGGVPRAVPASVIVWLATNPEAAAMSGQMIDATAFCMARQLVPGWPAASEEIRRV